jgi:hypothetical protein
VAIKPLGDRVAEAFEDEDVRAFGDKYLDHLLTSAQAIADALRRTSTFVVVLILVFFLLANARTAEFTFGPLKLTNVAAVLTLIPAVVSFLSYEFIVLLHAGNRYEKLKDATIAVLFPGLYQNDLEDSLSPVTTQAWGAHRGLGLRSVEKGWMASVLDESIWIVGAAIIFGTLGFLVYAYVHLFQEPKAHDVVVAVSLVFAACNVGRAVLIWFDENAAAE